MIQQNLSNPWQENQSFNLPRQGQPSKINIPDNIQWEHRDYAQSPGSGESDYNDNSDSDNPEEDFDELTSTQKRVERWTWSPLQVVLKGLAR